MPGANIYSESSPLVSVCIPSYNAEKFVGKTIQSVLRSTHTNLEIVVNDDASTDSTEAVVRSFEDARIHFFANERNVGPAKNWNRSLSRASGKYVGLLNHDDLCGPFWLSFAVYVLEKYPHIAWVTTAYNVIDETDRILGKVDHFGRTGEIGREEAFVKVLKLEGLGHWYVARAEVLRDLGYYDDEGGPGADNEFFLRMSARHSLYYSSTPHVYWRMHSGNLTHRWSIKDQIVDGFEVLLKTSKNNDIPPELRGHAAEAVRSFYDQTRRVISQLPEEKRAELLQLVSRYEARIFS